MISHKGSTLNRILAILLMAVTYSASAPAATLLPNGEQVFLDNNGNPVASGSIDFYIPGTTTRKNTCTSSDCSSPNPNPVVLDAAGRAVIYGTGCYRQVLKTSASVTIWDRTTCDTSTGFDSWSGTATGSPNAIVVTASNFSGLDGQVIRFIAAFNNSGATTLNPSSFGNVSIVIDGGSGPVVLSGGEIIAGNIVTVVYDATAGVFHMTTLTTITAGAGLSTAGVGSSGGTLGVTGTLTTVRPVNAQTGTSYTLLSTDNAKQLTFSNTSAVAVTVPQATGNFAAGFYVNIVNLNAGLVTLTPAAGTINGAASVTLAYGRSGFLVSDGTNWVWNTNSGPLTGATGYSNLQITNGAAPNTQIVVTADTLVLADTTGNTVRVTSVNVTANSGSSGANGLDTGAIGADTWYSIWVIYNPTTATTASLLSTSTTSPTMPSGYTFRMRVGWQRTDSASAFYRVIQKNDIASYQNIVGSNTASLRAMVTGASGGAASPGNYISVSVSAVVPTTARVIRLVVSNRWSGGAISSMYVAPNNGYGDVVSTNPAPMSLGNAENRNDNLDLVLESSSIYWVSSAAGGAIRCSGWIDNL